MTITREISPRLKMCQGKKPGGSLAAASGSITGGPLQRRWDCYSFRGSIVTDGDSNYRIRDLRGGCRNPVAPFAGPPALGGSSGPESLADCLRIGGGDFEKGFGGPAGTAGVLFPFVEGADTDGEQTGEFRLGKTHGFAGGGGVCLGFPGGGRLRQRQSGGVPFCYRLFGQSLQGAEDFHRIAAVMAIAVKSLDTADESFIFFAPANRFPIGGGAAADFCGDFHGLISLILS